MVATFIASSSCRTVATGRLPRAAQTFAYMSPILRHNDAQKNTFPPAKTGLDAGHDVRQVRLDYHVVGVPPPARWSKIRTACMSRRCSDAMWLGISQASANSPTV